MKKLFQNLGITITELCDLLLLPHSTISSWFKRKSHIPSKYSVYLSAFRRYEAESTENDLEELLATWEIDNAEILEV